MCGKDVYRNKYQDIKIQLESLCVVCVARPTCVDISMKIHKYNIRFCVLCVWQDLCRIIYQNIKYTTLNLCVVCVAGQTCVEISMKIHKYNIIVCVLCVLQDQLE